MTQAHVDLQSELDSQNISKISDPSTTPLCNDSRVLLLSPIHVADHTPIEQMETTKKITESLDNDKSDDTPPKTSGQPTPPNTFDQSHSTHHLRKPNMTLLKKPSFPHFSNLFTDIFSGKVLVTSKRRST